MPREGAVSADRADHGRAAPDIAAGYSPTQQGRSRSGEPPGFRSESGRPVARGVRSRNSSAADGERQIVCGALGLDAALAWGALEALADRLGAETSVWRWAAEDGVLP